MKIRPIIIYPFLIAYAENIKGLILPEVSLPLSVSFFLTLMLFLLAKIVFRDWYKAGIAAAIIIIVIENYILGFDFVRKTVLDQFIKGKHKFGFLVVTTGLLIFLYFLRKSKQRFRLSASILNVFSVILISLPVVQIAVYEISNKSPTINAVTLPKLEKNGHPQTGELPDIYYFILDRYGQNKTISSNYGYDNSVFIKSLEKKGFHIVSDSWSNYTTSALSLASSLNMSYLDNLAQNPGINSADEKILLKLIENNLVVKFLKSMGYKYIHVGSWWNATAKNKYADRNIKGALALSELSQVIYSRTIFYPITVKLKVPLLDGRYAQFIRIPSQFSEIANIPKMKEPTFIFAHFLIPHPPYVFDKDGNFITEEEENKRSERDNYIGQLEYANKKILELVNTLLTSAKDNKPIIVIQGDEGPYPGEYLKNSLKYDWKKAGDDIIQQKMGILNAIYFPDSRYESFSPVTSPVNSFRIVFNTWFNQKLELLPDISFLSNVGKPYDFVKKIERNQK